MPSHASARRPRIAARPARFETARYLYTGITDDVGNVVVPGVYPGAELGCPDGLLCPVGSPILEQSATVA